MEGNILILGASGGIGEAIALRFAEDRNNIIIGYNHNKEKAQKLVQKIHTKKANAFAIKVDMSSSKSIKKAIDEVLADVGRIDVLVCAQGVADYNILIDDKDENIENIIDVNLLGTIFANKYVAENMIRNQYGKIINISSIWGEVGGSGETVYSASKAGIIGFSKALAKELGRSNINVNVVAPGVINAGMCNCLDKMIMSELAEQTALGRLGTAEDVANTVYFLASNEAGYITGTVVDINGGF
ncbi:MAG: SDR family oxidoreductase [Clostridia bacterium]|nr:SDR family oxidoreductase [Clostridia bacterium]